MPETLERVRRVMSERRDVPTTMLPTVFPPDRIHTCLDARAKEEGE